MKPIQTMERAGRLEGQFGGVYRRCGCRKAGILERDCPHPWYYRFRVGAEQVRRRVGPGAKGKATAWQKLGAIQLEMARSSHLGIRTVGRATMAKYRGLMEPERRRTLTPTAYRAEAYRLAVASDFFAGHLSAIDASRIREFLAFLEERGAGPGTRNRYLCALSVLFQSAVESGYAGSNPVKGLKREREPRVRPPRVTSAEVDAIVARAPEPFRAPIRLCYLMGLRRAEAANLSRRCVDLERRVVVIRGKGGKVRLAPLSAAAEAVMAPCLAGPVPMEGDPLLFPGIGGPEGLGRAFYDARDKAGLPHVWLHHLRAAFLTGALEEGGASLTEARDLAGHSSVAVTDRYTSEAKADRLREVVERFTAPERRQRRPLPRLEHHP